MNIKAIIIKETFFSTCSYTCIILQFKDTRDVAKEKLGRLIR